MNKSKFATFFLAIIIGFLSGALISELFRMVLPTGVVKDFLTYSVGFGFDNISINLAVVKFSFGLSFSFTIVSMMFIAAIVYYFKWWL